MGRRSAGPRALLTRLSTTEFEELMTDKQKSGAVRGARVIELQQCPVCPQWMPARSREFGERGACGVRLNTPRRGTQ